MEQTKQIGATLGALIAAAGELAFEYSDNDQQGYRLARLALIEMVRKVSCSIDWEEDFDSETPRSRYLN
jgi:hypothetical protein